MDDEIFSFIINQFSSNVCQMFLNVLKEKKAAHSLKITIGTHQNICPLAANSMARADTIITVKSDGNVLR
eukprot:UN10494